VRVLIDAHMVGERETGNETYMANLLGGLARINEDDDLCIAAAHAEAVAPLISGGRGFTVVPVSANPLRRLVRDLPGLTARLRPDAVYATYAGPLIIGCPLVVAVHDVSFKAHPEWFSPRDRLVLNLGVGVTVRRAAALITLSEFSRREIETVYPVPAQRIHVIHAAPAPQFTTEGRDDAGVYVRYGIRRPYLLAVGNLQPRKNLVRLIEAFGRLTASEGLAHNLVLAGRAQWQGSEIGAMVRRLGLSERVMGTGYVGSEDLPAIYRGADLFVYPSLYEGFGLPVLEAMACGTPVVASNGSAIAEVAGSAARLVDPLSVEDLTKGMKEMCTRPEQREAWRQKGLAQSRKFTWERTARHTLDVLHGIQPRR
jgi:glycosyltransferase involved in cell wall biosynthesis